MIFSLSACGTAEDTANAAPSEEIQSQEPSEEPSEEPSVEPSEDVAASDAPESPDAASADAIRLAVLSGPTGIGAAKLLDSADNDPASLQAAYAYTIAADNTELVAGLSSAEPSFDIATLASNVAVNLYNKTDGGVKIIALGTLGVLHILESGGGTEIHSLADLAGRTIYAAGQGANPEYVLRYLLTENGVDPDNDVELVFADATEITQKLLTGEAECAMLPVPAATAAILQSEGSVRAALDLTEEWNALGTGSQLIMTAVVVRTAFAEEHPDLVSAFLSDYDASIAFVQENVDEAAELIAGYGITPSAAIAKAAIPQCHLTFISGEDMAPAISGYYQILYQADPTSVGGALPDDAIYYVP